MKIYWLRILMKKRMNFSECFQKIFHEVAVPKPYREKNTIFICIIGLSKKVIQQTFK